MMDDNPYQSPEDSGATPVREPDYPATFVERWGSVSVLFFGIALVGAVFLFCVLVTHLSPGAGKPDMPGFPLMLLVGSAWTIGALLLAWYFRK